MSYMTGKDMLLLPDGSTYHLGAKRGDVASRIITVGSAGRAAAIAKHLNDASHIHSSREMHIHTGTYAGVPVSVIAIGMGAPMMDFMMREVSFVTEGPLAVVRLGTCGIFNTEVAPGTIMTAGKGSSYIYVNYAHWTGSYNSPDLNENSPAYILTNPAQCSSELNAAVVGEINEVGLKHHDGLNACGETFYSCQGRLSNEFNDGNPPEIIGWLTGQGVDFVEMETHQLFHLGGCRKDKTYTASCAIGILNRMNTEMTSNIDADELHRLESVAGECILKALVKFSM
ncbi:MAG: hypothetical protein KVP17_004972 [Porospora cf. gigantea B]|uniref:uncharacterized protein n=2 Tax=Porospora cf. gigantea B TaxID=2853592 RepID=UPI003571B5BC|nr:MAG: hypothetical protein KVP17_004972 [Porospora cf. gigantea B]